MESAHCLFILFLTRSFIYKHFLKNNISFSREQSNIYAQLYIRLGVILISDDGENMIQGWPDLNQAIKVTKSDFFYFFLFLNVLVLFVVHNCRNEAINITKSDFFIYIFFICNSKFCINYQAIKVTKSDFFLLFLFLNSLVLFVVHNCRHEAINITKSDSLYTFSYL